MGKGQKEIPLFFLHENLLPVFFEEVFILIETDSEEVKEISNINIISYGTEVSGELSVEIQHILEITGPAATAFNICGEHFNFLGQNFNLSLCSHYKTVFPDIQILKNNKYNENNSMYNENNNFRKKYFKS